MKDVKLDPFGPFWTISDKNDFFAPNGQSRVWQRCSGAKNNNFCWKWSKRVQNQTILARVLTPLKQEITHLDVEKNGPKTSGQARMSHVHPQTGNAQLKRPLFIKALPLGRPSKTT